MSLLLALTGGSAPVGVDCTVSSASAQSASATTGITLDSTATTGQAQSASANTAKELSSTQSSGEAQSASATLNVVTPSIDSAVASSQVESALATMFVDDPTAWGRRGGLPSTAKSRKFSKPQKDEIVEAVRKAIYGDDIVVENIAEVVEKAVEQIEARDYASEIAQYEAAIAQTRAMIQQIIDAELDDEEAVLLLI